MPSRAIVCSVHSAERKSQLKDADFRLPDLTKISDLGEFDYVLACQILFFWTNRRWSGSLRKCLRAHLSRLVSLSPTILIPTPSQEAIGMETRRWVYKHPYPSIVHRLGFDILSRQFTEFHPRKVKLVMTAQRKEIGDRFADGLSPIIRRAPQSLKFVNFSAPGTVLRPNFDVILAWRYLPGENRQLARFGW